MPYHTGIRLLCVAQNPANGFPARLLGHGLAAEDVGDDVGRVGKFGQPGSPGNSEPGVTSWLGLFSGYAISAPISPEGTHQTRFRSTP